MAKRSMDAVCLGFIDISRASFVVVVVVVVKFYIQE